LYVWLIGNETRCYLLLVETGFESVDWERLIADTKRHTQPAVNCELRPLLLVEGTMVLNYRLFSAFYINLTMHIHI